MSYWTTVTPINESYSLVDIKGDELPQKDKEIFNSFKDHLIDFYKEGNLLFVYRGETFKRLKKRLFSNYDDFSESKLHERIFLIGEKARHFYTDKPENSTSRGWLTNINDSSNETFSHLFKRIGNVLSTSGLEHRIYQSCSSRFRKYFSDSKNCQDFLDLINAATDAGDEKRLKLRDYYLYFLHVAGSAGIREETMLVSTSLSIETSENFAGEKDSDALTLCGFIPQPYHNFMVSPWLASEYHAIASNHSCPTYQPFGLFPEQFEASIKGALFPCFILGIKQIKNKKFVVNPHIFDINNFYDAGKHGILVDQSNFMNSILSTKYMRFLSTDLQGNFEQYEL
ncbi:hypothetical protein [Leptothoe sp. PORK10 BA2]|uniref:hypothetical protein n=1 Tax=Leptothoe sp. PORK10 BA2 TaxID=3110254 RepID=UPI002B1F79C4|nr:hypothetical protein [Leptothoe sp. PORK10 BA2]MEA5464225.1 hypothetical protein [Leptothoe sp. PORK10 BA2]